MRNYTIVYIPSCVAQLAEASDTQTVVRGLKFLPDH